MLKKTLLPILFITYFIGYTQEQPNDSQKAEEAPVVYLKGQIVNGFDKKPLEG